VKQLTARASTEELIPHTNTWQDERRGSKVGGLRQQRITGYQRSIYISITPLLYDRPRKPQSWVSWRIITTAGYTQRSRPNHRTLGPGFYPLVNYCNGRVSSAHA